jgi:hypothetical protein
VEDWASRLSFVSESCPNVKDCANNEVTVRDDKMSVSMGVSCFREKG